VPAVLPGEVINEAVVEYLRTGASTPGWAYRTPPTPS
jgi:arginine/lysine/ornithine decarboxylase